MNYGSNTFKEATGLWSGARLREFLRSRGIIAPVDLSTDRLRHLVWEHRNDPPTNWDYSFESWSLDELENWFKDQGKSITGSRDQLVRKASEYLNSMKAEGDDKYKKVISKLQNVYSSGKDMAFDTWSDSDLKMYLDSYGISTYQGSTRNEMIALARRHTSLFRHGAAKDDWFSTINTASQYLKETLWSAASSGRKLSEKVGQHVLKPLRQEF